MLISKHFDPVLGIDIHILVIPPAGPVPIPHPHISLVFDVVDYVPFLGATVKVGGLPRSTAGTAGKAIPHIPMGGPFSKPPMNEDEIFMGSATVLADGGPLTFTALPSLSCHDIGMISPPRKKKPKKSFGMLLPTSMVVSIPLGMPVMVGGPPTVDMMALAMTAGFAALGKAFKKLRKMQKKSKRMKKISDAIHSRAKKAMDKLGVPPNIRNKVHKGICTVTGHPVDVATGKMFTDHIDFSLPGPLPLVWERTWYSTSVYDGPLGHGWHHSYDVKLCEMDNAVAVRMADGRGVAFPALDINETSFNRQERMTLFRDEEGYALDTSDKKRYRFTPFNGDKENQLLASLSQTTSGAAIRFFYNEKAQLHHIIDSGNRPIHITYTDEGRIHQIYLPEPESNVTRDHTKPTFFCAVEHHYRNGMLVRVDDALQQALQYHYDNKLLIKETFRSGLSFYFEYDGRDHNARCLRTWGDEGIYYRDIRYDTENNITWVKNSLGHVTTYYHNGVLPHKVVDPLGYVIQVEYNEHFDVICETSELGYKTHYEYDEFGNETKTISPEGSNTKMVFDQHQNLIELINPMGNSWRYEYNSQNQLVLETNLSGHKIYYEYKDGLLSKLTDTGGNSFYFHYDQNLNVRWIAEDDDPGTHWEFDALGNVLSTKDNQGNLRHFRHDKLSRVVFIKEPDGNTRYIAYDSMDNIVHVKDQQYDVSFSYLGMGNMASRSQNGITVKFEYDREEQLVSIINEHGRLYHFEFDANGEVVSESGFDRLIRRYVRDPCRRITQINRPGNRYTNLTYDRADRPTLILHSDGSRESYHYRADGELIKASTKNITTLFERDAFGRVIKESQGEYWVASQYDESGFRSHIKSSLGLNQINERDKRGFIKRISAGVDQFEANFLHDNQGFELQRSLPGGISSKWARDRLGRPIRREIYKNQQKIDSKSYVWGVNDRLLKVIDSLQRETVFNHDVLGNLISARYSNNNFEMRAPDAVGNLFKTVSQKDREYGPAGQLLAIHTPQGTIRYQYDAEGNLCRKQEPGDKVWQYEWNDTGTLRKVIRPDGKTVAFNYDALGRRISKIVNNKVTYWVWDGSNPLHEWRELIQIPDLENSHLQRQQYADEIRADQREIVLQSLHPQGPPTDEGTKERPITWLFEPDNFSPLAKLIGDDYYSIITDHLGTPVKVFDKNGAQIWEAGVSIWGEIQELRGEKNICPFRWPGQYEDEETGLYYNRFRYYDPSIGQYISQDPIGLDGGYNLYQYVSDTSIWTDEFGLANIYRRKNGRFGGKPGPKSKPKPSLHGNSKTSTKPAVLYAQYDDQGKFQKWGITQETSNPKNRYRGKNKLPDGWDVVEMTRGKRSDMLKLERELAQFDPGPRNFESWAGKPKKGQVMSARAKKICGAR